MKFTDFLLEMKYICEKKEVYFDSSNVSLGKVITVKHARNLAWRKLPDNIKNQISKKSLKPMLFKSSINRKRFYVV